MRITLGVLAVATGLASAAAPLAGHHSWTSDHDGDKAVTVKGV
jgi:hypothetical protein